MSFRRALSFSFIERYGSYAIAIVSTIVISRILGPADIGAFSVGASLAGVLAVIREMGVSTYVIQEESLTEERLRAAFTVTISSGLVLALVVLALSWPAGAFYGDARVGVIVAVLALGFAITPFGSIAQSLIARDLGFGTLAWIRLSQSFVLGAVGIILASLGFGPVSLAWAVVAAALSNAVISTWAKPHSHKPNFALHDLKRVAAVGLPATGTAIIDDIAYSFPELVLGRWQNLAAAGLFSRARGLSVLAHQVIVRAAAPVVYSEFASLKREGLPTAPAYLRTSLCVTALGWLGLGVMAVLAGPVVRVLFGPQWTEVVPLLRWLCGAACVSLITSSSYHLLLASGGAMDALRARLAWFPIHIICVAAGAFGGPEAMAVAVVVSTVVNSSFLCVALRARTGITFGAHFSVVKGSAPIALLGVIASLPALLLQGPSLTENLVVLAAGASGALIAFLAGLFVSKHPLRAEIARLIGILRKRANGRQT